MKRSSGDNSWVVAPCENSSMPGKILSVSFSFDFLIKADFVSHLVGGFFVGSIGQILGGLGLPATPETVLVGVPPVVAQRLH